MRGGQFGGGLGGGHGTGLRAGRSAMAALALVLLLAMTMAGAVAPAARAEGGARVALVIGNSAYRNVTRLANPGNDARLVARTLKADGFTLIGGGPMLDLDKAHFDAAVAEFGRRIVGADVALFYYSGHGLQLQGENQLVPVDANPEREQDVDFQMVAASLVLRQMAAARTRLNLVILDACRNNPFAGSGMRAAGGGLAEMRAASGTVISYSTQPGSVAFDGTGADSPYTAALAEALNTPGLSLFSTFNRVGLAVKKATGGKQEPWLAVSPIEGDFFFAGNPGNAAPLPAAALADEDTAAPARAGTMTTAAAAPPRPAAPPPAPLPAPAAPAPAPAPAPGGATPVTLANMTRAAGCAVPELYLYAWLRGQDVESSMPTSGDGWCWITPLDRRGYGLSGSVQQPPAHGQVVALADESGRMRYAYRPQPGYAGPDSFKLALTDRYAGNYAVVVSVDVKAK